MQLTHPIFKILSGIAAEKEVGNLRYRGYVARPDITPSLQRH